MKYFGNEVLVLMLVYSHSVLSIDVASVKYKSHRV